jgi:hypothetical protein
MLRDFNRTILFIVDLSKKILSLFLVCLAHLPNLPHTPCMARKSIIWIVPLHTRKQFIIYMCRYTKHKEHCPVPPRAGSQVRLRTRITTDYKLCQDEHKGRPHTVFQGQVQSRPDLGSGLATW